MNCEQLSRLHEMLEDACIEFDHLGTPESRRRWLFAGNALREHLKFHECNLGMVRISPTY